MSIGSFCILKNESRWIAANILSAIDYIDEMSFYDGGSTDGTLEIIKAISNDHKDGYKIKLLENKDPKDLTDDYVRLSNEAMHSLNTDLAIFLHPDQFIENPSELLRIANSDAVALSTNIRSFAGNPGQSLNPGNPGESLFEMHGRAGKWKNIYRLRNPDLGAHYFGHYGAWNEDCYFSAITGDQHHLYENFDRYPYAVEDSGLNILHFSDVRPYERRLDRMVKCLLNNDWNEEAAKEKARTHPRVTFKDGGQYSFTPCRYPETFSKYRDQYAYLEGGKELVRP